MRVKAKLVDAPRPDLVVGVRCSSCSEYVLNLIPLSRIVPKILYGKAREALAGLHGDEVEIEGVFTCGDCADQESEAPS